MHRELTIGTFVGSLSHKCVCRQRSYHNFGSGRLYIEGWGGGGGREPKNGSTRAARGRQVYAQAVLALCGHPCFDDIVPANG